MVTVGAASMRATERRTRLGVKRSIRICARHAPAPTDVSMHIGLFTTVFPPQVGGMERFAEDLARGLHGMGHRVTVVGPKHVPGGQEVDAALPFRVVRDTRAHVQLEALRGVDVVHVNGNSLRGIGLAQLARRPLVITHSAWQALCPSAMIWSPRGECTADARHPGPCSTCLHQGPRAALATRAHRAGPMLAGANIAISRFMEQRLGLPRCLTIYNPVADRAFEARSPGPGDADTVVFAGRLVQEKGLGSLLHALVHLPQVQLEVVGDGPLRGQLQGLAGALGIALRVTWHGTLPFPALANAYARAAVVCAPSALEEPFGYAVAEAMAMERPVVATRRGAFTEMLTDDRGWLAPPGDVSALASALGEALSSPTERLRRAARARAFAVSEFRMEPLLRRHVDLYQRVA